MNEIAIETVQIFTKNLYLSNAPRYLKQNLFTWKEWQNIIQIFISQRMPAFYFEVCNLSTLLHYQRAILEIHYIDKHYPLTSIEILGKNTTYRVIETYRIYYATLGIWLRNVDEYPFEERGFIHKILRNIERDYTVRIEKSAYNLQTMSYLGKKCEAHERGLLTKAQILQRLKRLRENMEKLSLDSQIRKENLEAITTLKNKLQANIL